MPYEKIVPEWNAQGINPPQSLKDAGWQFNQAPPADYFNWFFYNTAQAIIELQLEAINKDQKGATDGLAPLVGGKVPNSYLNISAPADASLTVKGIVMLDNSTTSESETKAATPKAVKTVADNSASHASNTNIHVTAQEKASYAAKETTTGAQTKADAAAASAKTYADQQDALLIPLSQKGVASGVATLGSDGKVPSGQLSISAPPDASTTQKGIVMLEDSTTSTSVTKAATPNSVKILSDQMGTLSGLNTTAKSNLVAAVNELFQFANDGKVKWSNVVGSPLTSSDTFTQMQTKTQTIKNTLATNLTAKGQSSTGTETLTALVNKVANVNTGKKFATGSRYIDSNGYLSVTTLDFSPSVVEFKFTFTSTQTWYFKGMLTVDRQAVGSNTMYGVGESLSTGGSVGTQDYYPYLYPNDNGMLANGFKLRFTDTRVNNFLVTWKAWE